jgi:hypothetical protein
MSTMEPDEGGQPDEQAEDTRKAQGPRWDAADAASMTEGPRWDAAAAEEDDSEDRTES